MKVMMMIIFTMILKGLMDKITILGHENHHHHENYNYNSNSNSCNNIKIKYQ